MGTKRETYCILGDQFQPSLRADDVEGMLRRVALLSVLVVITHVGGVFSTFVDTQPLVALSSTAVNDHLLSKRVVQVDIIVFGVFDRVVLVVLRPQGLGGAVSCHEVQAVSVGSFWPFNREVIVDQEDVVELGLMVEVSSCSRHPSLTVYSPPRGHR